MELELDFEIVKTAEALSYHNPKVRYFFFEDNCKNWPKYKEILKAMARHCAECAAYAQKDDRKRSEEDLAGLFCIEMQAYFNQEKAKECEKN